MSHPARGPIGTMGIDGKASAIGRRHCGVSNQPIAKEAAA
jgi:hypothetical protein